MDVRELLSTPENMDYVNIDFTATGKDASEHATYKTWTAKVPFIVSNPVMGIDPGRNFGITVLHQDSALVWYGKLTKREPQWKYGLDAFAVGKDKARVCDFGVVEGPIFRAEGQGKLYGEANLANIRFGFLLGILQHCSEVDMVPPASSRKTTFGSAKVKGMDVWTTIDPNAAESLVLAICAAKKKGWYTHGNSDS